MRTLFYLARDYFDHFQQWYQVFSILTQPNMSGFYMKCNIGLKRFNNDALA